MSAMPLCVKKKGRIVRKLYAGRRGDRDGRLFGSVRGNQSLARGGKTFRYTLLYGGIQCEGNSGSNGYHRKCGKKPLGEGKSQIEE